MNETSEKYENEYCNLVNANEASNKHSIERQRHMIADIRKLQAENEKLRKCIGEEFSPEDCLLLLQDTKQLQAERDELYRQRPREGVFVCAQSNRLIIDCDYKQIQADLDELNKHDARIQ